MRRQRAPPEGILVYYRSDEAKRLFAVEAEYLRLLDSGAPMKDCIAVLVEGACG